MLFKDNSGLWFITGSVAKTGRLGAYSDVDILCVTKYVGYLYSESCYVNGIFYQIVFLPEYKLLDVIAKDSMSLEQMYLNMIENAIPIVSHGALSLSAYKVYISKLKQSMRVKRDEFVTYSLFRIKELCQEMQNAGNDKLVIASDLFNVLLRYILDTPEASSKHLGRRIAGNKNAQTLRCIYEDAVNGNNYDDLVGFANGLVEPFIGHLGNTSTGISLNIPSEAPVIIFIPQRNIKKPAVRRVIAELEKCYDEYKHYSFYIGPNQVLEYGTYVYIDVSTIETKVLIESLIQCHQNLMQYCITNDIKLVFPYNTAFASGYYFGGKSIYCSMLDQFEALCCLYFQIPGDMDILSYGVSLCVHFCSHIADGQVVLSGYLDSIALDAVDPNGLYNIRQAKIARDALKKHYDTVDFECIIPNDIFEADIETITGGTAQIINDLKEDEIIFPELSYMGNRKQLLIRNAIDHMLSILCLSQQEKYAVVYYT